MSNLSYIKSVSYATTNAYKAIMNKLDGGTGNYWYSVFYYLDVWLNAITGGNPEVTVSGRTGYYNLLMEKKIREGRFYWVKKNSTDKLLSGFWKLMMTIIDQTFEPIDGDNHCYSAYEYHINEFREEYGSREAAKIVFDKGWIGFLMPLLIVSSLVCIILYPFNHWLIDPDTSIFK